MISKDVASTLNFNFTLPNAILPRLHTFVSSLHGILKPRVGTVHCTRGSTETKSKKKSKQKSKIKKYIRKILREIWRGALGLFFFGIPPFWALWRQAQRQWRQAPSAQPTAPPPEWYPPTRAGPHTPQPPLCPAHQTQRTPSNRRHFLPPLAMQQ